MSIHAPETFQAAQPVGDERRRPRLALDLPIFVLQPGREKISAVLIDLSEQGCRVAAPLRLKAGRYVGIEIPDAGRHAGWVVWQRRGSFGLDFSTTLADGEVARVARLSDALR